RRVRSWRPPSPRCAPRRPRGRGPCLPRRPRRLREPTRSTPLGRSRAPAFSSRKPSPRAAPPVRARAPAPPAPPPPAPRWTTTVARSKQPATPREGSSKRSAPACNAANPGPPTLQMCAGTRWRSGPEHHLAEGLALGEQPVRLSGFRERQHAVDDGTQLAELHQANDAMQVALAAHGRSEQFEPPVEKVPQIDANVVAGGCA